MQFLRCLSFVASYPIVVVGAAIEATVPATAFSVAGMNSYMAYWNDQLFRRFNVSIIVSFKRPEKIHRFNF